MSNPNPSGGPVTWNVTSQVQTVGKSPAGPYVPGVKVAFSTSDGHAGEVFIPQAEYIPDNVRAKVEAAARMMSTIGQFSGQV